MRLIGGEDISNEIKAFEDACRTEKLPQWRLVPAKVCDALTIKMSAFAIAFYPTGIRVAPPQHITKLSTCQWLSTVGPADADVLMPATWLSQAKAITAYVHRVPASASARNAHLPAGWPKWNDFSVSVSVP